MEEISDERGSLGKKAAIEKLSNEILSDERVKKIAMDTFFNPKIVKTGSDEISPSNRKINEVILDVKTDVEKIKNIMWHELGSKYYKSSNKKLPDQENEIATDIYKLYMATEKLEKSIKNYTNPITENDANIRKLISNSIENGKNLDITCNYSEKSPNIKVKSGKYECTFSGEEEDLKLYIELNLKRTNQSVTRLNEFNKNNIQPDKIKNFRKTLGEQIEVFLEPKNNERQYGLYESKNSILNISESSCGIDGFHNSEKDCKSPDNSLKIVDIKEEECRRYINPLRKIDIKEKDCSRYINPLNNKNKNNNKISQLGS
jgi:hypothetical protein